MSTNILPNEDELFFQLALSFVPNVGSKTARLLLNYYDSAKDIFKASVRELKQIDGVGEVRAGMFRNHDAFKLAEKELAYVMRHDIGILLFNRAGYPKRLLHCDDAPLLLFYKGTADLDAVKTIAVIGTRSHTDYGERITENLLDQLSGIQDLIVISGLAFGIDTIAHRACIKNGIDTVGVLGHGMDRMYPATNRALSKEMMLKGGLLTEFPSGTKPDRQNFPVRNRIVAGMSDVTVVVESDVKGGAMITAYLACSYNREVAAFPGRVYDSRSGGPNMLIRKNIASMITDAGDLLALMRWDEQPVKTPAQQKLWQQLSDEEHIITTLLQQQETLHSDELRLRSGFSHPQLAAVLLQLEMHGIIKSLPGKMYLMN